MTAPEDLVERLRAAGCVFAEDEAALIAAQDATGAGRRRLADRRAAGEPLEQVLGWAAFAGLRIAVAPGVFVPRRRTELLAERAAAHLDGTGVLVDLCCGSGAVGAAVRAARPGVAVHAVDSDPRAVACARANLPGAAVHHGDLDAALPDALRGRVDVLTACAPYVPSGAVVDMPREARDHEPLPALDGGPDGLDVVRRIVTAAPGWLRPGGVVLLEIGADQVPAARTALAAAGLGASTATDDERGATVVVGTQPDRAPSGLTGR